jgi:hypothetical protein
MYAKPGAALAVLPDEAVPGGRRGPHRAEPLGEDGERAGRDVTIIGVTMSLIARTSVSISRDGEMRGQDD